ncbi:MAG: precorrin-3B C(17)-methyltransferase [Firmicutes bacterium]|nr:precorrin-3B C(17)-methyltransferase [Bacillota bacterium]
MKIYVVGIGPGSYEEMSLKAIKAIEDSDVIVGYDGYIKLIENLTEGKEVYSSGMKRERERCAKAVEFALEGKKTAVISSGDAGIYGMAGLIHEICEKYEDIEIETIAGITACSSAAARLGAPIMNDFAVISLSDLMTPWEIIEKRIKMAAEADFVICIYNPSSKKRTDNLKKACEYISEYRSNETICGYVKNIAREGEEYEITTLGKMKDTDTDMFTTVIVGNSTTRSINGKMVTPRGYEIK